MTTDENGYYVCSVLAGDTVQFIGETFVANSWDWDKNIPVKFIDGEGFFLSHLRAHRDHRD